MTLMSEYALNPLMIAATTNANANANGNRDPANSAT